MNKRLFNILRRNVKFSLKLVDFHLPNRNGQSTGKGYKPSIIPWNSENKPRDLYFSKALFEGLIFGGAYIRRGLSTEGNLRFKIDWASLIVGMKFTVFSLFWFVFEGNFQVQAPGGAYIRRSDLTEGFLRYEFGGLIFGGAYTWRGLFSKFYGILKTA